MIRISKNIEEGKRMDACAENQSNITATV